MKRDNPHVSSISEKELNEILPEKPMTPNNTQDLDRWLAENVMGFSSCGIAGEYLEIVWKVNKKYSREGFIVCWHPTTNLLQAFELVEKMIADGFEPQFVYWRSNGTWRISFSEWLDEGRTLRGHKAISNKSLPLAICEAIYKTKGKSNE
jgi:hypothetical protein